MNQNLIALSVNVARAYEIATAGNHSLSLIPGTSTDEITKAAMLENCKTLKDFYGIQDGLNSDIVVEMHMVGTADIISSYTGRSETKTDIEARVAECKKSDLQPVIELKGAVLSLLKTSIDRLQLSIRQVNSIMNVSRTIAKLSNSDQVRPEHIAEAIQYQTANR